MGRLTDNTSFDWWVHEPRRLEGDLHDVATLFPNLTWYPEASGEFRGSLPVWPFGRPEPDGLAGLLDGRGLDVIVRCGEAYPVVAASVIPVSPEPLLIERTQHDWHVNGDGSLCLLQNESAWTGTEKLGDLILKAAGWRIEYALMKCGAITSMTVNGIVNDPSLDGLIGLASPTADSGNSDRAEF